MEKNHDYQLQLPDMLREEILRIFNPIVAQQLRDHEPQAYFLSLGTSALSDIRLEIRSESECISEKPWLPQMRSFAVECSPEPKYEKVFQAIIERIQAHSMHVFNVKPVRKKPKWPGKSGNAAGEMVERVRISGEIDQTDFSAITNILAKFAMVAICEFDSSVDAKRIGFVTGNILSQNQTIPSWSLKEPEIRQGVALDVFHTIQDGEESNKKNRGHSRKKNSAEWELTRRLLENIQQKSAHFLSLRDPSYLNGENKEQILDDYRQSLSLTLPDEVCREILWRGKNEGFEILLWHGNLAPMYLRVGEFSRKHGERIIGFAISVRENDADRLWDELAENFKKYDDEIGTYEITADYSGDSVPNTESEVTIILEIPIIKNRPGKIRNVLFLFWKLFYEFGYPIAASPEVSGTFGNSDRKLQEIAKNSLREPKIQSLGNR